MLSLAVLALVATAAIQANEEAVCKTVIDGPKLAFSDSIVVMPSKEINVGDTIELTCTVLAAPTATILWLHNGKEVEIQEGPKEHILSNGKRLGISMLESRLVRECATAQDAGTYSCVALSPCHTAIKQSATVTVKGGKATKCAVSHAPIISLYTNSRMEIAFSPVQLVCRSAYPLASIHWERMAEDESTYPIGFANSGFLQLPSGDLIVDPSGMTEENGQALASLTMRCIVSTAHGSAFADSSIIYMDE